MSTYLWKVTALRSWNQVKPNMFVEVVMNNSSGKPSTHDIKNALESKYSIKIADGLDHGIFNYEKS